MGINLAFTIMVTRILVNLFYKPKPGSLFGECDNTSVFYSKKEAKRIVTEYGKNGFKKAFYCFKCNYWHVNQPNKN